MKKAKKGEITILKNGLIIDGTGAPGTAGSVVLNGPVIQGIVRDGALPKGRVVDCTGMAIAPGFIDCHSHMDWFLGMKDGASFKVPFTEQGITTFIGGNCGFSPAGIKEDMPEEYVHYFTESLFKEGLQGLPWRTLPQYFARIRKSGLSHNMAMMAGHGTIRASVKGFSADPLSPKERREMRRLFEKALDDGAGGVSFGLQYEPGLYAPTDEIEEVAGIAAKKNRIVTVHMRALSAISAVYPIKPFGTPHNLIALEEMLGVARRTGARLQVSHLIFAGERTWKSCDRALEMIDRAIDEGIDVMFDTYSYHCGASVINVVMPAWYLADLEGNHGSSKALRRLKIELKVMEKWLGLGPKDIQVIRSNNPELDRFNGMFLHEIARQRGMGTIENLVDMAYRTGGNASILLHKYSDMRIIEKLMRHRASLFMTDAWVEPGDKQNPAAYGCFPRFLQIARERKILTLEEVVRKMTGATAERFGLKNRGFIQKGMAADIVVFDPAGIRDNNTIERGNARPDGIAAVFMNGARVLSSGAADVRAREGEILAR
ncbi:MAG: amidohydrolase family protein [Spirochaetes bacterium]|nr:amidohydrolase family protein [Spirochaetota bacterium]